MGKTKGWAVSEEWGDRWVKGWAEYMFMKRMK